MAILLGEQLKKKTLSELTSKFRVNNYPEE